MSAPGPRFRRHPAFTRRGEWWWSGGTSALPTLTGGGTLVVDAPRTLGGQESLARLVGPPTEAVVVVVAIVHAVAVLVVATFTRGWAQGYAETVREAAV